MLYLELVRTMKYLFLLLLCFFATWHPASSVESCTPNCEGQSSNLIVTPTSFNATVTWDSSFGSGDPFYLVQHRQQNSGLEFETSPILSSTSYIIEGLQSSTQYEVQVCLANDTTNCGNCLKCFTTLSANEAPSAPRDVVLSSTGPQSITVSWKAPTVASGGVNGYIVFYGTQSEGLARNFTLLLTSATITDNIMANTTYVIAVSASNAFGIGPMSAEQTITTETFSTVPGALLVVLQDSIIYYPVAVEDDVGQSLSTTTPITLLDINTTVIDIDYDYRRSYIYTTVDDSTIVRYSVSVDLNEANAVLTLTHTDTETVYSGLGNAQSIAVDWVNDRVYWVEHVGGNFSQLYSGPIDGGSIQTHGRPLNGVLDSLTVDPIHGYFYWVIQNVQFVQVNLSVVVMADSNTDLAASVRVLFSGSKITSFTLDLADSQYYYAVTDDSRLVKNGLGGNALGTSAVFNLVPTLKTSFGRRAVFSFQDFLVIREASIDTFSQGEIVLTSTISDARVFRSSYQPLPIPPGPATNVRVLAMSDSVLITWDGPEYQADVFGSDAFRAWEYFVDYRPLDSSDTTRNSTRSTSITLTSLTPGTTYTFTITIQGITSEETITTSDKYVFTTFGTSNTPTLLISSDEGVLLSDTLGTNTRYLSRRQGDRSTDAVSNAFFEPTLYYFCTDTGQFFSQNGVPNITDETSFASQALDTRNDPAYLQLDWISRRLYWVEQSSTIVRVPTIDFSSNGQEDLIETFEVENSGDITDTAIDSFNGVFFWVVGGNIKAKTLNGLQSTHNCYTLSVNPRAISVDSVNKRLFILYFSGSTVSVAKLNYTTFSCDESSFTSRAVRDLSLNSDIALSMAYAANTLYFSQYSSLDVKSISAEFATVGNEYVLALGCIRVEPSEAVPEQLRALSVVLVDNQPLPDGLAVQNTGDETLLAPPPPGVPSLNEATSNTTFIDVTWEPSDFMFSDVFYRVELNLTSALGEQRPSVKENVLSGNSIQLSNQTFSTTVEAWVLPYSLWFPGNPVSNTFQSPAALPAKVQNVRAYVYFPVRSSTELVTAQVVWDGLSVGDAGGMISSYSVNIVDVMEGKPITSSVVIANDSNVAPVLVWNGPPFLVDGSTTEFAVVLAGFLRNLYYPLRLNREYTVNVTAINSAGYGEPSDTITFYTNVSSPPREVLISSTSGGRIEGEGGNTALQGVTPPLAIGAENRTIYYYDMATHSLMRGSLDVNVESEQLTALPEGIVPLSFTYDWVGQTVYIIGRDSSDGSLEVWTVFDLNPVPTQLHEIPGSVENEVEVSVTINPFRGFIQWTQHYPSTGRTSLYQLNLRDMTRTTLVSPGTSRKRDVDPSSLTVTRAIAWDPFSGEVWVCDQNTGDIISCNTSSSAITNCVIRVNASKLGANPTGLPADYLAIDENTIYWSNNATPTVYYIPRSDPTSLQTFSTSDSGFVLLSISPGQQPFPDLEIEAFSSLSAECLSPDFTEFDDRPVAELVSKTNTTLELMWDTGTRPTSCEDVIFSTLPLSFQVDLTERMTIEVDGFPKTIFDPMITITNLEPYTRYSVKIEASNQYSLLPSESSLDFFGAPRYFRTREGVPSPLTSLNPIVYGPRDVYLSWDLLTEDELKGHTDNQTFLLYRDNVPLPGLIMGTSFNFTQLTPNGTQFLGVVVSNGVLESALSSVQVRTFSLPPEPVVDMDTLRNTSLVASVVLTEEHPNITNFRMCIHENTSQMSCELASDFSELNSSAEYPLTIQHTFTSLSPFTVYRLFTQANYSSLSVNDQVLGPVTDTSTSFEVRTAAGVPDAPIISIQERNMLQWIIPDSNGDDIDRYILHYQPEEQPNANFSQDIFVVGDGETSRDLTRTSFEIGIPYLLTLVAQNGVGSSEKSNQLTYTLRAEDNSILSDTLIIGLAAGGGGLLIFIFIVLIIIFCCCCSPRSKSHYGFAPDIELLRLREEYAKSRQIAFNPNYIWSRDDYTAYQDDLDNINKFPRNRLRLENFIDRGEFGEVYQGTAVDILAPNSGPTPVAVKTMRKGASTNEKEKFLSEAALMSNFNHQNIVKVLGVCLDNDPLYIIMELMPAGDLLKFLREARRDNGPPLLTLAEQVQVAIDVAQGCRYLEQQHFIHRDIAARNCLVSSKGADRVVKIGDFGLAKDLYSSDYYQVEGQRKLPVRWMAPEALTQGKFAIETDIWSYGVLLWEIFTFGNQPYPGRNNQEVVQFITGEGRLDKPENCSIRVYKLMEACWEKYPSERLHFAQIVEYLAHYLEHVNNKRDSYYSDEEDEGEGELSRKPSRPSRNSSVRSGLINLARQGSVRIRRSIRGRSSLHKKEDFEASSQNHTGLNSEENLIDDDRAFRERGPF